MRLNLALVAVFFAALTSGCSSGGGGASDLRAGDSGGAAGDATGGVVTATGGVGTGGAPPAEGAAGAGQPGETGGVLEAGGVDSGGAVVATGGAMATGGTGGLATGGSSGGGSPQPCAWYCVTETLAYGADDPEREIVITSSADCSQLTPVNECTRIPGSSTSVVCNAAALLPTPDCQPLPPDGGAGAGGASGSGPVEAGAGGTTTTGGSGTGGSDAGGTGGETTGGAGPCDYRCVTTTWVAGSDPVRTTTTTTYDPCSSAATTAGFTCTQGAGYSVARQCAIEEEFVEQPCTPGAGGTGGTSAVGAGRWELDGPCVRLVPYQCESPDTCGACPGCSGDEQRRCVDSGSSEPPSCMLCNEDSLNCDGLDMVPGVTYSSNPLHSGCELSSVSAGGRTCDELLADPAQFSLCVRGFWGISASGVPVAADDVWCVPVCVD